jgi:signal transduction histidine kinase
LAVDGAFVYDIKLAVRNIDDRKKQDKYQKMVEEKACVNEAKLRYISCIAHDLKTPLQSFAFSLDLLAHTHLTADQKDYLDQATVAVDLMRLTISQTMDISKALTGTQLQPRRTTVHLGAVVRRVKVIMYVAFFRF